MTYQDENAIKPCPECQSTEGYDPVGYFRARCVGCGAILKNEEVLSEDALDNFPFINQENS